MQVKTPASELAGGGDGPVIIGTPAPEKNQCTKLPKRIIQRSEYQDAVDINDNNIKQHPHYYKRRQAICEHPFGSIKRHWGYTHTLLKGLQKVNGELSEANHEHKKQ